MKSKLFKAFVITSVSIVIFTMCGWIALRIFLPPEKLTEIVTRSIKNKINAGVVIAGLDYTFTGKISIDKIILSSGKEVTSLSAVSLIPSLPQALLGNLHIRELQIKQLRLDVYHRGGRYVIPLLENLKNKQALRRAQKKQVGEAKELPFGIDKISCIDCRLSLHSPPNKNLSGNYDFNITFENNGSYSGLRYRFTRDSKRAQKTAKEPYKNEISGNVRFKVPFAGLFRSLNTAHLQIDSVQMQFNQVSMGLYGLPAPLPALQWMNGSVVILPKNGEPAKYHLKKLTLQPVNAPGYSLELSGDIDAASKSLTGVSFAISHKNKQILTLSNSSINPRGLLSGEGSIDVRSNQLAGFTVGSTGFDSVRGDFRIEKNMLQKADLKVTLDENKKIGKLTLQKGNYNLKIQNNRLLTVQIAVAVMQNTGSLGVSGAWQNKKIYLNANLYFPVFKMNSMQNAGGRAETSHSGISVPSYIVPNLQIKVDQFRISETNDLRNVTSRVRFGQGIYFDNIRFQFADTTFAGSWSLNNGVHSLAVEFAKARPAKIPELPFGNWYGTVSGRAAISFMTAPGMFRNSLNGTLELTGGKGRLVNTLLQKGFLSGPAGALEGRIADLEYLSFRTSLNFDHGRVGIREAVFTADEWRLRVLGSLTPQNRGDLRATLHLHRDFIRDIANPAYALLSDRQRGAWYHLNFECAGPATTPNCWKLQ